VLEEIIQLQDAEFPIAAPNQVHDTNFTVVTGAAWLGALLFPQIINPFFGIQSSLFSDVLLLGFCIFLFLLHEMGRKLEIRLVYQL
jgi:hypothetical protein